MKEAEIAYWGAVKSDAMVFFQQAFKTVYPSKDFHRNWHLDAIVNCLEKTIEGKMPRLIINLPPRHLKSFMASVAWPAFVLGNDPTAKLICISYSDDLAKALSFDFKRIVESDWYRRVFPDVRFVKTKEGEFVTDQGGSRYATSVGGTLTGRGGDFIIIDDPIKAEDAMSEKARQFVNDWFRSTPISRLEDKGCSVLILVMQRLHVNDLTGFVEAGGGFHKLSLPAIAMKNETIALRNGKYYERREGEALHEAREGLVVMRRIRDDIGAFHFASQYQQSPSTPDGAMFKRRWFKFFDQPLQRHPHGMLYVSIDSALSTSITADYSVISLVYVFERDFYVLSTERGRWDYEQLKEKALRYRKRYGDQITFLVEGAGSGISLIEYFRKELINCFSYKPNADKVARAARAIPILEDGRVHILNRPGKNAWVEPYINEFVNFPFGRFDDQVDSLTQLLVWADPRHNPQSRFYPLA